MKYKVYDEQNQKYMFGEVIFNSKKEAIEQLISFYSADHSEQDLKAVKEAYENSEEYFDIVIRELKEFKVIIDFESKEILVHSFNNEEAEQQAIKEYKEKVENNICPSVENYWIGECDEVKNE